MIKTALKLTCYALVLTVTNMYEVILVIDGWSALCTSYKGTVGMVDSPILY